MREGGGREAGVHINDDTYMRPSRFTATRELTVTQLQLKGSTRNIFMIHDRLVSIISSFTVWKEFSEGMALFLMKARAKQQT